MRKTLRMVSLIAIIGWLSVFSSSALAKARGTFVLGDKAGIPYEIGNDVKKGVDGLIIPPGGQATSLTILRNGSDGSVTILFISFTSMAGQPGVIPLAAGTITLEPPEPGALTRRGVLLTTKSYNWITGAWIAKAQNNIGRTPVAFVPDKGQADPFAELPLPKPPPDLGSAWVFTNHNTAISSFPDSRYTKLSKVDDHHWRWEEGVVAELTSFDEKTAVWTLVIELRPGTTEKYVWTGTLSDDFKKMSGTLKIEATIGEATSEDTKTFTAVKQK
jgi:hypothetical protein